MEKAPRVGNNLRSVLTGLAILLALAGFGLAAYLFTQVQALKNDPKTSQQAAENRTNEVKAKVAKLISLPSDEKPILATVDDKEKLKSQPFFKDAENGDVILIFPQAKKAVVYRENENKLINVGPIAITSDAAQQTDTTKKTTN